MEALYSSESMVAAYKITWHHTPENGHQDLESQTKSLSKTLHLPVRMHAVAIQASNTVHCYVKHCVFQSSCSNSWTPWPWFASEVYWLSDRHWSENLSANFCVWAARPAIAAIKCTHGVALHQETPLEHVPAARGEVKRKLHTCGDDWNDSSCYVLRRFAAVY
jgi:hypothetical protein